MKGNCITRQVYGLLRFDYPVVDWRVLMYGNIARPRAIFTLWMACHGRLATKDRLNRFGVTIDDKCCFCPKEESLNHLFFGCIGLRNIWWKVLNWLQIDHVPLEWGEELGWLIRHSKGKGWKAQLLKSAAAEAVYTLWNYRNDTCFGNRTHNTNIDEVIVNTIVYRGWMIVKLRKPLAHLML
jgi:hypothetical protein